MIVLAKGPGGERILPAAIHMRLDREEDAPADSMEATFPLSADCGPITGLTVSDQTGTVLFDGIVDEQEICLTDGTLSLASRSRAALLLDNEALPQNYMNPSLATIFSRHLRPYGFTQYLGDGRCFTGTLAVTKGMSEWTAAAAFCTRFLKTKPRITGRVFDASGSAPKAELLFGTGGLRFSSALFKSRYCKLYSELYVPKPGGGTYLLSVQDQETQRLTVRRRRFLSGGTNVSPLLKKAKKNAFACLLDCPGAPKISLLSPARVTGAPCGFEHGLYVSSIRYLSDVNGEHTKITLRRK